MTPERLVSLAVGHALAANEPVGAALRALDRDAAAALADAGSLAEALGSAGLPRPLVELAAAWPQAVLPAVRRLGRIPGPLRFQAPLFQLLGYLGFAVLGLGATQVLLHSQVLPNLTNADLVQADVGANWPLFATLAALVMGVPAAVAGVLGMVGSPRLPSWGRDLRTARQAALAAALWESGAPAEVRNRVAAGFLEPACAGVDASDADRRAAAALALASRNHARFVSVARLAGLGILTLWAFGTLARVYVLVSQFPVTL